MNALRVLYAIATNQVARFLPGVYMRFTGFTGRGGEAGNARVVADYFWCCFDDYLRELGLSREQAPAYLEGKRVLEYGPGDILGVALLFVAYGARSVTCVDRFALLTLSPFNVEVMKTLLGDLEGDRRERAERCFVARADPASGFTPEHIRYRVTALGLVGEEGAYALIVSRAVLAVVNDLEASLADMKRALAAGGVMLHKVDLASHGMHRRERLDFLTWDPTLWGLMHGAKSVPNRWRLDRYRELLDRLGFIQVRLARGTRADVSEVQAIRSRLARPFRDVSDADLACLDFWLEARKG